jgi:hypothetical protein
MSVPLKYYNMYAPVKLFLSSYRALSDGQSGVRELEEKLYQDRILLSDWKVSWAGTCTILRASIDLFKIDRRSCISPSIRREIGAEWNVINDNRDEHAIFWDFLREERNNIIHGYNWRAYETWMKPDGTFLEPPQVLVVSKDYDGARPFLKMKAGRFKGRNSLDLLRESADWIEQRIFSAIHRAGFDPEEMRSLGNFSPLPKSRGSLLGGMARDEGEHKCDEP